jgi:hypothetical protein
MDKLDHTSGGAIGGVAFRVWRLAFGVWRARPRARARARRIRGAGTDRTYGTNGTYRMHAGPLGLIAPIRTTALTRQGRRRAGKSASWRVDRIFVAGEMIRADIAVAMEAEAESFIDSAKSLAIGLTIQTQIRTT